MSDRLIRNCQFRYRCDQQWSTLETDKQKSNIRHCKVCNEDVHLCKTDKQLLQAIRNNMCVALQVSVQDELPALPHDIMPPASPASELGLIMDPARYRLKRTQSKQ